MRLGAMGRGRAVKSGDSEGRDEGVVASWEAGIKHEGAKKRRGREALGRIVVMGLSIFVFLRPVADRRLVNPAM